METKLRGSRKSRLGRLNAIKNIDYEPSSAGPSSPISFGSQTSFRIEGIDGEIDRICWSLGLSGPEEFAIPTDVWEARKSKSTTFLQQDDDTDPLTSTSRAQNPNPNSDIEQEDEAEDATSTSEEEQNPKVEDAIVLVSVSPRVREHIPDSDPGGGGGINGFTPPSLHIPLDNQEEDSPISSDKVDGLGSESPCSSSTSNDSNHDDDDDDDDEYDDDVSTANTQPVYIISPNVSFKRNIKSWSKGALLGSGSFGTVYEGLSEDGFFFAVKEVSLLDQGNQAKQSILQLEQEISLLSQFEHENIVQYLGTDKDEEKLYIFLELITKGSIAQLYQKYHLHDSQVSAYTRQILHGLKYLHDRNVVHRDIKCANILVDTKGYVKLADFGLAKATKFNDVKSCKGTAFWMAPEVVNRRSRGYGLAADIWSLGCTVLEMLTRQLPYSHLECMQALFRIGKGEPPPVSNSLSTTARDFIHRCLQVNADDRPTAALLLEHPFVNRPLSASSSGSGSPLQPNWRRS